MGRGLTAFLPVTLLVVLGLTLAAVVSVSDTQVRKPLVSTVASTSCQGESCNYQDPETAGCTDGETIDSFYYSGARPELIGALLELRFSRSCDAAWIRITGGDCNVRDCGGVLQASRGQGAIDLQSTSGARGGTDRSNMLSFRYYVRGCFASFGLQYDDAQMLEGCTAWH